MTSPNPQINTNPLPGVNVKMPAADIDKAFELLFSAVHGLPPFLEAQTAIQRLTEASFWLRHALHVKALHDAQREKQQASKIQVS